MTHKTATAIPEMRYFYQDGKANTYECFLNSRKKPVTRNQFQKIVSESLVNGDVVTIFTEEQVRRLREVLKANNAELHAICKPQVDLLIALDIPIMK